jgi:hypothetical protein
MSIAAKLSRTGSRMVAGTARLKMRANVRLLLRRSERPDEEKNPRPEKRARQKTDLREKWR